MDDLEAQITQEAKELESLPKIPVSRYQPMTTGSAGRCHWCGRPAKDLVYVDTMHDVARYKGVECCGQRNL
jgi:hypothetical protein